jgi:UDP-glucose 4-epimerase
MRILITGITGRIGANVAAALRAQGHAVRGLVWGRDQRVAKLQALDVELLDGSLTEPADVRRAVAGVDAIYHLGAAFQGGGPFSVEDYFQINVRGTFNVLEAAREQGAVQQIVVASTDALYEKYVPGGLPEPIREDALRPRPRGWYALSKSLAEDLSLGYFRTCRLPVTVVRFALVVGAGEILDFPQFYLSKLKDTQPSLRERWDGQEGQERLVVLKDAAGRPYKKHIADVRDIVSGCVAALGKPAALGEVFQLAGPAPFTWDRVIPYLSQKLGIPAIEASLPGAPTFYEFDLAKARGRLGFTPRYDVFRMIDDALAFRAGENIGVLPTA